MQSLIIPLNFGHPSIYTSIPHNDMVQHLDMMNAPPQNLMTITLAS